MIPSAEDAILCHRDCKVRCASRPAVSTYQVSLTIIRNRSGLNDWIFEQAHHEEEKKEIKEAE